MIFPGSLVTFKQWSLHPGDYASMWQVVRGLSAPPFIRHVRPQDIGIILDSNGHRPSVASVYVFYLILVEDQVGFVEKKHVVFL